MVEVRNQCLGHLDALFVFCGDGAIVEGGGKEVDDAKCEALTGCLNRSALCSTLVDDARLQARDKVLLPLAQY